MESAFKDLMYRAAHQGWDQAAMLALALRYIDYLSGNSEPMTFSKWLENQADWQNNSGLDVTRLRS